ALAGAQPREVFLQVLEQAQLKANAEEIEQDDAAVCNDETCDIPQNKQS
ncbi:DsbA family oxidoreductase, partial [Acinetobacter baumannii]